MPGWKDLATATCRRPRIALSRGTTTGELPIAIAREGGLAAGTPLSANDGNPFGAEPAHHEVVAVNPLGAANEVAQR